jgi:hypothetical protein
MTTLELEGFPSTTRARFGVSLPLIFGIGIFSVIVTHAVAVLRDPDTLWHIVVGRWIIEHWALPSRGLFSATMANAPWVDQQWLAEVLMAWAYNNFGWSGLAIGTALCEATAIAMLLRILLGSFPPVYAMFATTLAGALWFPHLLARPYILTIPILVLWVAALVRAGSDNRVPPLWLALLIVLWANLHGSFMFGIGIAGLLAAEAVLLASDWQQRIRVAWGWALFEAVALGAALLTPNGIPGLLAPLHLINMSSLAYIGEWQGMNFSEPWSLPILLWLLFVLFAALSLGWRLPWTRVAIVLLLLTMALKHLRYMELLGFVSALLIAPSLALQVNRQSATSKLDRFITQLAKPANWRGISISGAIMVAIAVLALRAGNLSPPNATAPVAAIEAVQSHNLKGPAFNSYQFGGYLIFSGIAPFIDGRAELYGDDFLKRYIEAVRLTNDSLPQILNDYGITWTILPANGAAVLLMDHLSGWRRLHTDPAAVVHVRGDFQ